MHRRFTFATNLGAVAVCAALASEALSAPVSPVVNQPTDAQCLLLSNFFAKSASDPKAKQIAFGAHFYYLGRLHIEVPPAELQSVIAEAGRTILPALAGATMQACLKEMQSVEAENELAIQRAQLPQKK